MASSDGIIPPEITRLDEAVAGVQAQRQLRGRMDAELLDLFAEALDAYVISGPGSGGQLAFRALRLEMSLAAGLGEQATERLLNTAWAATVQYPSTLAELRSGGVLLDHVHVIIDAGGVLVTGHPDDERRRAAYERDVLEYAREETANRLRPIAKRLAAEHAEATLDEQHEEALRQRSVRVVDADAGMADLIAHLPAEEAYAIKDRLTRIALETANAEGAGAEAAGAEAAGAEAATAERGVEPDAGGVEPDAGGASAARAEAPPRSRDEVRADALCDLLLDRPGVTATVGQRVRAQIQVVVPAGSLSVDGPSQSVGSSRGVAELVGYGPISDTAAVAIAAEAEAWERIIAGVDGEVLAVDRYRPTPQMRRRLAARDLHCRAPGCRTPAARCDIDHTRDAAHGGPTRTDNLAHLCRGHHVLKHHTEWTVTQQQGGELRWRSPSGREYVDKPPSRVRFRRVREPGAGREPDRGRGGVPEQERGRVPEQERSRDPNHGQERSGS